MASAGRSEPGKKLLGDVLATAVLQLVSKARGLILLPILVRVGSESLYGVWTLLAGVLALLVPLVNLSAHQGLLRFGAPLGPPGARRLLVRLSVFSWSSSLAWTVVVGVGVWMFVRLPEELTSPSVLIFTALQVPLLVAGRVNSTYLRARGRIAAAQMTELGGQFLVTFGVAVVFLAGFGLASAQAVSAAVLVVQVSVVTVWLFRMRDEIEGVADAQVPSLRMVIAFSVPFVPSAVSDWALFVADRYILASFRDAAAVGVYAGAYALAQALQLLSYPLEYSVTPMLPRLWDGGKRSEAVDLLTRSVHLALFALAPASTVMVLVGPLVLGLVGSRAMADASTSVLPLLCWGLTIFACTRMVSLIPIVAHQGKAVTFRVGVAAVVNLALNFALVPPFGVLGAAIATLLAYAVYAVLIVLLTRKLAPELTAPSRPLRICIASLVPAAIAFFPLESAAARVAAAVGYLIAYAGLLGLLRGVTKDDWAMAKRTLRRR